MTDLVLPPLGLVEGLSNEAYHAGPGVSNTGLKLMSQSMAHYYAAYLDPNRPPAKERAGQLEGTLAHCAILEPDTFDARYVTLPENAPRRPSITQRNAKNPSPETIEAIGFWEKFEADTAGKVIISHEQRETALRQAESVRRLPEVAQALDRGQPEISAYWEDPDTGVLCRVRPDWVHDVSPAAKILLDVKTCSDASPAEFARQVARKRYYLQDAFYSDGYSLAGRVDVLAFIFVAVESEYPYAASAVMLDDRAKQLGFDEYRRLLARYAECCSTGVWPAYGEEIELVSLPAYLTRDR